MIAVVRLFLVYVSHRRCPSNSSIAPSMEAVMLSKNKAKEMKRRRASAEPHIWRAGWPLTLRAERRMAGAAKAEIGKTEVRSKGHVKPTVKKASPRKNNPQHARILHVATHRHAQWRLSQRSPNKPWAPRTISPGRADLPPGRADLVCRVIQVPLAQRACHPLARPGHLAQRH